jgi:hypothetical protein
MNRNRNRANNRTSLSHTPVQRSVVPASTSSSTIPSKDPSLAAVAKQGFAWGLGNAMAHTLLNTIGSRMISSVPVSDPVESKQIPLEYKQCMEEFNDEPSCKHFLK